MNIVSIFKVRGIGAICEAILNLGDGLTQHLLLLFLASVYLTHLPQLA